MPADVIDQLEMVGRLLDDVTAPVTLSEITHLHVEDDPALDLCASAELIELATPATSERRPGRTVRLVAVAAAVGIVAVTGAYVWSRDPDPAAPATGTDMPSPVTVSTADEPVVTVDPLVLIAGLDRPPGETPPDVTFRGASRLGDLGVVYVYDSRDGTQIWTVITFADGGLMSAGYDDRETVDSGQAYALLGQPGYTLLTGLAPTDIGFSATIGSTVLRPDANGVWFTLVPPGSTEFTMSSELGTHVIPIIDDRIPQTTVAAQTSIT